MFDSLISIIAPHLCYECGKIGSILCDNCKYNITMENFESCLICGSLTGLLGACNTCATPYKRAWCVGERSGSLQKIIDSYKFYNNYDAHHILGDLLRARMGILPGTCNIVPVPTVPSHIRQRGYDHAALLAKHIARRSGCTYAPVLKRKTTTVQRGKNKLERQKQAARAFTARASLDSSKIYLIVDDVVTTGATLLSCTRALQEAGATEIWVAAIARQPLD
jgi:ComF family protein